MDQRDRVGEALKKHGAFFAFNKEQYEKEAKPGIRYISLGAGLIAPKDTYKELIKDIEAATAARIKEDLEQNSIEDIINRELANHEALYTMDIEDTVRALEGYGITEQEIQKQLYKYSDQEAAHDRI